MLFLQARLIKYRPEKHSLWAGSLFCTVRGIFNSKVAGDVESNLRLNFDIPKPFT